MSHDHTHTVLTDCCCKTGKYSGLAEFQPESIKLVLSFGSVYEVRFHRCSPPEEGVSSLLSLTSRMEAFDLLCEPKVRNLQIQDSRLLHHILLGCRFLLSREGSLGSGRRSGGSARWSLRASGVLTCGSASCWSVNQVSTGSSNTFMLGS